MCRQFFLQTLVKLFTIISNTKSLKELHEFNLSLYGRAEGNWERRLDVWLGKFQQISSFHIVVHWLAVSLLICFPVYGYFVLNIMIPFFDLVIPFVDVTTVRGYFIMLAFQLVLCVVVVSIMYSVDYLFILTLFSGIAIMDLIEEDCKALTVAIENSNGTIVDVVRIEDLLTTAIRRNQFMRM